MKSELFEETLKQHKDSLTDELVKLGKHRQAQLAEWDIEQNESDYEFYFNSGWNAQQSKVDELTKQRDSFIKAYEIEMDESVELQKKNAWLSDVAERENKRANKLQEEKVSTTTLLGKTIQEKNELQKRVDKAIRLLVEAELYQSEPNIDLAVQALKGGGE